MQTKKKDIIVFDEKCLLCNKSVQFILKNDTKKHFLFCSSISKIGQLTTHTINTNQQSVILIRNNKLYTKSDAVFRIAQKLRFPINLCWLFLWIPQFIRNGTYDIIAKNRYKWFGKTENCWYLSPDLKDRFLV